MNYIDDSIDMSKVHLYKNNKSLLSENNITKLKKEIKEVVKPPTKDTKVYIVNYIVNVNNANPLKIIIAQYTLTPKLALVIKDGDNAQTFTFSLDELKKYKFKNIYVGKIISLIKVKKINFKKLSVSITDVFNVE
jgi:hypothetical protein